ncbi:putative protein S-acyltransferase 16 [Abeliophyllum distichum]|uniref:Uncharacterized protein n=1 Tax=Abeliophyllum distichum TaxID=126358 RepID=A0ABD1PMJ1_9LAMI
MLRGCGFSFHITLVTTTITYIYFSTVLVFIDQWFGLGSLLGMLNAAIFTLLAFMCIYSCYLAAFTDPSWVLASFVPDVQGSNNPIHEIKRKYSLHMTVVHMGC